ncbi:SoxR reducing system RseC family protein [Spongiibacter sp.]|uniref:SoxR reducing system RseC family protein n=1 Tax=Spongiibacter sp. TaxID=2024860 RepID=UPI0035686D5E
MICERGRVVAVEETALWVETISQSSCSSCAAKKGCGQGLMNSLHDGRRNQLRVALDGQSASRFPVGCDVDIAIPETALLSGVFIVYLLPLLSMMGVMMAVAHFTASDKLAALGAAGGLLLGLLLVRLHAAVSRDKRGFQPRILGLHRDNAAQALQFSEPN